MRASLQGHISLWRARRGEKSATPRGAVAEKNKSAKKGGMYAGQQYTAADASNEKAIEKPINEVLLRKCRRVAGYRILSMSAVITIAMLRRRPYARMPAPAYRVPVII